MRCALRPFESLQEVVKHATIVYVSENDEKLLQIILRIQLKSVSKVPIRLKYVESLSIRHLKIPQVEIDGESAMRASPF